MKIFPLIILCLLAYAAHTQVRDVNKTTQIEQLKQLKETVTRRIDTLHFQLSEQALSIAEIHKKLDGLKKERSGQDKPDIETRAQASTLSQELVTVTNLANNLQKKFDQELRALDKAVNLQKDLEDKIHLLIRESNR